LQPLLFRQSAKDPMVFALIAGVMLVVALVAAASPALRAVRVDPNRALRGDC
jgi:ABC-type lipoprotein release transport system permease subunit